MAKKLTKKPAPKKTKAIVKKVKQQALEFTYVTIHWLAFNGRTGEMVGLFTRNKGEVFSMVKTMEQAIERLEAAGNKIATVTLKNFFEVPKHVAELYLKEKGPFETKRQEEVNKFVAEQKAIHEAAQAAKEAPVTPIRPLSEVKAMSEMESMGEEEAVVENDL